MCPDILLHVCRRVRVFSDAWHVPVPTQHNHTVSRAVQYVWVVLNAH